MTAKIPTIYLLFISLTAQAGFAEEKLSAEQAYTLFNQANEAFRTANAATDDPQKAKKFYETAILSYEKIINEGQIKNPKLYYNLANAYFLNENLGLAILNYRRAENLDKDDDNIQKNLAFARARCIDKVTPKTKKQVLHTLLFWHYDLSLKTKFLLACLAFAILCISLTVIVWMGQYPSAAAAAVISAIIAVCFFASVVAEAHAQAHTVCGIITADEVVARQGDGQNYPASFKDPLHAGTEFNVVEQRPGWLHIKLADDADAWVPSSAAGII
jgi:tetratricopeptide (TPR) repeat protein